MKASELRRLSLDQVLAALYSLDELAHQVPVDFAGPRYKFVDLIRKGISALLGKGLDLLLGGSRVYQGS